jgi:hypothetical protein
MKIKLMPDYKCHPLWSMDAIENIDPASLPISSQLSAALTGWANAYDNTLNVSDPASSGFSSAVEEQQFAESGKNLHRRLLDELGPEYHIEYEFTPHWLVNN